MIFFEVAIISKLATVRYDQLTFSCEFEFSKFAEKMKLEILHNFKIFCKEYL
jgi:hypothetical protein